MRTILLRVADKQVFSNVKCNRHMRQLFIAVAGVVFVGADHFPDIEFVPEDATVVPGFPIAFNATPCCPLLKSDGTPATLTLRLTSASPRLTLEPSVFTWDGNDTNAWKQTQTFTATGTAGASYDLDIFSAVSTTIESDSDLYNQDTTVHLRVGLAAHFSPPPKPPPPSPPPVKPPPPGPPPGHPCPPVPPSPPQPPPKPPTHPPQPPLQPPPPSPPPRLRARPAVPAPAVATTRSRTRHQRHSTSVYAAHCHLCDHCADWLGCNLLLQSCRPQRRALQRSAHPRAACLKVCGRIISSGFCFQRRARRVATQQL